MYFKKPISGGIFKKNTYIIIGKRPFIIKLDAVAKLKLWKKTYYDRY